MLKKLLKLYVTAMTGKVYSPVPHLFGPPGCGKSEVVKQAAQVLGVNLHIINVSRISPLELEGVQMPSADNTKLNLLTATFWTQLKEGDILLFDEFLRGFPEVYNGLLDIITSREVGGFKLPNVFILAASNSTAAYDKALEDRLLHLPVADPRTSRQEHARLAKLFVGAVGLLPAMATSFEIGQLLDVEVLPMFNIMDQLKNRAVAPTAVMEGTSLRNLIGQVKLREVQSGKLKELIKANNSKALLEGRPQHIVLMSPDATPQLFTAVENLGEHLDKLNEVQLLNYNINMQLIQVAQQASTQPDRQEEEEDDDLFL